MCINAMSLASYVWQTFHVTQSGNVYATQYYSYIPKTGSSSVGITAEYDMKYGSLILEREKRLLSFPLRSDQLCAHLLPNGYRR